MFGWYDLLAVLERSKRQRWRLRCICQPWFQNNRSGDQRARWNHAFGKQDEIFDITKENRQFLLLGARLEKLSPERLAKAFDALVSACNDRRAKPEAKSDRSERLPPPWVLEEAFSGRRRWSRSLGGQPVASEKQQPGNGARAEKPWKIG
ncbi:MAG: hypothetical protein M2R46_02682 [Verrucomicrobia subdivision 3 bacterium]|nr:hypothetical protein [Limisphaerales bacterium]